MTSQDVVLSLSFQVAGSKIISNLNCCGSDSSAYLPEILELYMRIKVISLKTFPLVVTNCRYTLFNVAFLGGAVTEAHFTEVVEVSKEPNLSVEPVQETFKDLCPDDDQKEDNENKKAEKSSEVIKKEIDLDLKQRGEILPKKNKKHKAKERAKKKGKCEREQKEDGIKNTAQAINSPEKENDTSYSMRCNPPTTPYLER